MHAGGIGARTARWRGGGVMPSTLSFPPIGSGKEASARWSATQGAGAMTAFDHVLDRRRVREVTGIFHARDALDATANELLLTGFDRADIDILANLNEGPKRLGPVYVAPEELADVKQAPRRPFIGARS